MWRSAIPPFVDGIVCWHSPFLPRFLTRSGASSGDATPQPASSGDAAVAQLPACSHMIDVNSPRDELGIPNFRALYFNSRAHVRCVWAFDLLYLNGRDLRSLPSWIARGG